MTGDEHLKAVGDSVTYDLAETRKGWVHVATGNASINGGASITLNGVDSAELLLFDMQ